MSPPNERDRGLAPPGLSQNGHPAESSSQDTTGGQGHETSTTVDTAQADLFADYARQLAESVRDVGMAASKAADPEFVSDVLEWIWNLPTGYRFDADLIRSVHGRSPAAGSVVNTARKRGWIRSVGVTRSKSITRHAGLQLEWERT